MSSAQRLRFTFSTSDSLKYVGHLDLVRTWERALRRAGLPLAYSEGFNPQARLQFASALPVGATGRQELADVILTEPMDPDDFVRRVRPQLPTGLSILAAVEVPLKSKALQALLRASEWQADVQVDQPSVDLAERVADLLSQPQLPRTRQRPGEMITYDLRPLILEMHCTGQALPGWQRLHMTLRSEPSATGRPHDVLAALGLADLPGRIERLRCIFAPEGDE